MLEERKPVYLRVWRKPYSPGGEWFCDSRCRKRGEALADGSAEQAQFHDPQGVTVADDGIIYVSDTGNNAVRKIQNGVVSTIALCDQNAMDPSPVAPVGLMVKGDRLYVCDNFSRAVLTYPR